MEEIVNRVSNSALVSIDLDDFLDKSEQTSFDVKQALYQEMVLREKDFRQFIKDFDWEVYRGKNVFIHCSADAIIPSWAYMLVATKLVSVANLVTVGSSADLEKVIIDKAIDDLMATYDLNDAKIILKGCGNLGNRDYAYFEASRRLLPFVSSLMYGEPCSTVPVYKRPKNA